MIDTDISIISINQSINQTSIAQYPRRSQAQWRDSQISVQQQNQGNSSVCLIWIKVIPESMCPSLNNVGKAFRTSTANSELSHHDAKGTRCCSTHGSLQLLNNCYSGTQFSLVCDRNSATKGVSRARLLAVCCLPGMQVPLGGISCDLANVYLRRKQKKRSTLTWTSCLLSNHLLSREPS